LLQEKQEKVMAKRKKNKHSSKYKNLCFLFTIGGAIIFLAVVAFFLFFSKEPAGIYIFPENPKQGDTVFIRVTSQSGNITGNFETEKLFFYRKGKSDEWISFLGIDADQKPGDYKVAINISGNEKLMKDIKVSSTDFSNKPAIAVFLPNQSAVANEQAISNIRNNDNPAISKVISNLTAAPYFTNPFSSPLGVMKQSGFSFGQFIGLGSAKIQHLGVDLNAAKDTEIYAVNDGKVVAALNLSNYGKTVIIDHGLDIFSMYLHLDEFKVAVGQMVKRGQDIGLSGETGYVSGPHLHFSMRVDGTRVDPAGFIKATQQINDNSFIASVGYAFSKLFGGN
jgi:murein DD-endopeptidase MepM/ murein hydrolase activator NlpD